jgi:cytidylate kinase
MANFAIAADENVIARGNKLIEELQEPGEKKGVTLNRLFDLVSTHLQEDQLKRSGVDTEALDASITNIRNLFTAALSGKEEIRTEYERRMAELRERNEELEKNYKIQLGKLITEKEEALRKYNDLKELQETAESARKAAEEQTASAVNLAKEKDVVMDGRDIGTTILPNAEVKIFLTASAKTRANRRYLELTEKGEACDMDEILKDIIDRDERDMNRAVSPLKQAEDAVLVDSSEMGIEEVVESILSVYRKKVNG